jgi:hypothetical protein
MLIYQFIIMQDLFDLGLRLFVRYLCFIIYRLICYIIDLDKDNENLCNFMSFYLCIHY